MLLLQELAHPVMVGLLPRHLLIPFLEIGSSMIPHPYDIFFFYFLLGPCILAGHPIFSWDVQTLSIVYMTFMVYGQCLWFVFMDLYLWIVFMAMCMAMCL